MSTTYTAKAGLALPAPGDKNWGLPINANTAALDGLSAIGGLAVSLTEVPSASLNVKVGAGTYRQANGTVATYAGVSSQVVSASGTTCLWLTDGGTLTTGSSFPTGSNIVRLASVVAGSSTVTSITDARLPWQSAGAAVATGTVTNVGLSLPAIFSVTGSPVTSSGTLTASLATQSANVIFAGPSSGSAAAPTFRALVTADLPSGTGTVTSVGLSLPSGLSVSGSPVTTSGTLTATWSTQAANVVFAGPSSGSAAAPTWRAIVAADLPVFVGSGTGHAPGAVPDPGASSGTTHFLREDGTWAVPPSGGSGSVTSVGLSLPAFLSVSGSPVTSSGTLTASLATQSANVVFAGPSSGSAAAPTWRALVTADLPSGTGTVTSVGLSLPSGLSVSGSPVTTSGTLTATWATQSANVVFAGPSSGSAAAPTWRAIVAADLPSTGLVISSSYGVITADTDGSTITFNLATSNVHSVTLGGNRTLALTGGNVGQRFLLRLSQDGTGSRTVTWWSTITWISSGGSAPTLPTAANAITWVGFICTGSGTYDGFLVSTQ